MKNFGSATYTTCTFLLMSLFISSNANAQTTEAYRPHHKLGVSANKESIAQLNRLLEAQLNTRRHTRPLTDEELQKLEERYREDDNLYKVALSEAQVGRFQKPLMFLEERLKQGPDRQLQFFKTVEGLADVYTLQGRNQDAILLYRSLVTEDPKRLWASPRANDLNLRVKFALALQQGGLYDEAWANYSEGVKDLADPNGTGVGWPLPPPVTRADVGTAEFTVAAHLAIANRLKGSGDAQMLTHLREVVRLWPTYSVAHYHIGNVLYFAKTANKAEAERNRIEALKELNKAALYGREPIKKAVENLLYWDKQQTERAANIARMTKPTIAPGVSAP